MSNPNSDPNYKFQTNSIHKALIANLNFVDACREFLKNGSTWTFSEEEIDPLFKIVGGLLVEIPKLQKRYKQALITQRNSSKKEETLNAPSE